MVLQNAERIGAGAVLNAAGAYGVKRIANSIGVELPIERRKRYAFVFDCRQSIGPAPLTILPQGIGFRPEGRGYLSNTAPPPERDPIVEDDDFEIEYDLFDEIIWPSLAEYIPAFEAVKLNRAYCCHYDFNTLDEKCHSRPYT